MISQIHLALLMTLLKCDKNKDIEYGSPKVGDSIKSYFFFADSLTWPGYTSRLEKLLIVFDFYIIALLFYRVFESIPR